MAFLPDSRGGGLAFRMVWTVRGWLASGEARKWWYGWGDFGGAGRRASERPAGPPRDDCEAGCEFVHFCVGEGCSCI